MTFPFPSFGLNTGYGVLTQITDYTGSTNIGDLTVSGGLAAAFDGNTGQTAQTGARHTMPAQYRYIGKGWAASKRIGQYKWWMSSNEGGVAVGASLKLYGKDTAPSSATDGTLLHTRLVASGEADPGDVITVTDTEGIITSTKYLYHWVTCDNTAVGNQEVQTAEIQFWGYAS